jgi:glycerol-3-phosphate acyltransferase PlsX
MKVALDAMGGDLAPRVNLTGAAAALERLPELEKILLVGERTVLETLAGECGIDPGDSRVEIVHAAEVIGMSESGAKAVRRKKQSSISVAMDLVKEGAADAFVSAGNTGACVAAAQLKLRLIPGIERAGIASALPNEHRPCHLLDAGANPGAKASHLLGYAVMGSAFCHGVYGVTRPKVGIMSNGEEQEKGNALTRETFTLIQKLVERGEARFEFLGNVEGHDLFESEIDICLCDGFTGNVVLKSCEATAKAMSNWLKRELMATPGRKLGALIARGAFADVKARTSAESVGGSPLLGVNGVVVIAHGGSSAVAIHNAIRVAVGDVENRVNDRIRAAMEAV